MFIKDYRTNWKEVIEYMTAYLSADKIKWLKEYTEEAGEDGIAFDLLVEYILDEKIPVDKKIHDWIKWFGTETEKLGTKINPDWKNIK